MEVLEVLYRSVDQDQAATQGGLCDQESGEDQPRRWSARTRRSSSHGCATHPLSQIIDCPHTRGRLSRILGIDDEDRLLNLTRAGRVAGLRRSIR
jgi:hypothetical protein